MGVSRSGAEMRDDGPVSVGDMGYLDDVAGWVVKGGQH